MLDLILFIGCIVMVAVMIYVGSKIAKHCEHYEETLNNKQHGK